MQVKAPHTLAEWLQYIETLHPQWMELGLERVQKVAQHLGVLQFNCPIITVGGTNGKGTCVACLEAIYRQADFKVGAYTSPHLIHFNERIRMNTHAVTDKALINAFQVVEATRQQLNLTLTYFEFTTLAALWLFQHEPLDILILEVGLGGRLDAINIIDPTVAVITTIALDHMEWLGADREAIGKEKAGIFRATRPAVCGDFDIPASIIHQAAKLQTPLYRMGYEFGYDEADASWQWWSSNKEKSIKNNLPIPQIPLQNAATALKVIECLQQELPINDATIQAALVQLKVQGRFQYQEWQGKKLIFDVAHNEASALYLAQRLKAIPNRTGRLISVFSQLQDKKMGKALNQLATLIDEWHIAPLQHPRGSSIEELKKNLCNASVQNIQTHGNILQAFDKALSQLKLNDYLIVWGSFYTVGECLAKLKSLKRKLEFLKY